ncbi:hypothetical protein D3C76_165510 [compost metagenome]
MIQVMILVGAVLALLVWYTIRRYNNNPSTVNVWLVAWAFAVCIVFLAQIIIHLYLYGLSQGV